MIYNFTGKIEICKICRYYLSGLLSVFRFGSHFDEPLGECVGGLEIFEFEEKILGRAEGQDQVGRLQFAMSHISRHFGGALCVVLENFIIIYD